MFKRGSTLITALLCSFVVGPSWAAELGDPAPPLKIKEWVKGGPIDLRQGLGRRIYVVEFWAVWCQPCRENIPHLTDLQRKFKDKGLVFVGISDEPAETVRPFVRKMGSSMDYVVAIDDNFGTNKAYLQAFGVNSIPHAFIVDETGRIAWHGNPAIEGELERAIEQVVEKAGRTQGSSPWNALSPPINQGRDFDATSDDEFWPDREQRTSRPMAEVVPNRAARQPFVFDGQPDDSPWAAIDAPASYPMTNRSGDLPSTETRYAARAHGRPPNIEIEIDSLDGKLYRTYDGWRLEIEYEVEAETNRRFHSDGLELILSLSERGYRVVDREGQPFLFRVPLDRPTEVDDDEIEFEGRLAIDLPYASLRNPDRLRLRGDIRSPGYEHSLDRKYDSVRFKSRRYRRYGGVYADPCNVYVDVGW